MWGFVHFHQLPSSWFGLVLLGLTAFVLPNVIVVVISHCQCDFRLLYCAVRCWHFRCGRMRLIPELMTGVCLGVVGITHASATDHQTESFMSY